MTQVILQPNPTTGKDTYTDIDNPTTNYGAHVNIRMDDDPTQYTHLEFDIAGIGIPAGATIDSAVLEIYVFVNSSSSGRRCYRVTSSWNENTLNWNTNPTIDDLLDTDGSNGLGWKDWDVATFVQKVIDGDWTNYGFQIREVSNKVSVCHSSDYATDPSLRPKLTINYTPAPLVVVINETSQVSENVLNPLGLKQIVDETAQVSEDVLNPLGLKQIVDEASQVSENVLLKRTLVFIVSEIAQVSESILNKAELLNIVNETAQVSETTLNDVEPIPADQIVFISSILTVTNVLSAIKKTVNFISNI